MTQHSHARRQDDRPGVELPPPLRSCRRPSCDADRHWSPLRSSPICLGALLAGWAWTATTNTQEVLVARDTIERGSVIEAEDLARVRISADPALTPRASVGSSTRSSGSARRRHRGRRPAHPGLVHQRGVCPPTGQSVVGVALTPAQAPGLDAPDRRPGAGRRHARAGRRSARQAHRRSATPRSSASTLDEETGQTVVDLLVPHADASVLAAGSRPATSPSSSTPGSADGRHRAHLRLRLPRRHHHGGRACPVVAAPGRCWSRPTRRAGPASWPATSAAPGSTTPG